LNVQNQPRERDYLILKGPAPDLFTCSHVHRRSPGDMSPPATCLADGWPMRHSCASDQPKRGRRQPRACHPPTTCKADGLSHIAAQGMGRGGAESSSSSRGVARLPQKQVCSSSGFCGQPGRPTAPSLTPESRPPLSRQMRQRLTPASMGLAAPPRRGYSTGYTDTPTDAPTATPGADQLRAGTGPSAARWQEVDAGWIPLLGPPFAEAINASEITPQFLITGVSA